MPQISGVSGLIMCDMNGNKVMDLEMPTEPIIEMVMSANQQPEIEFTLSDVEISNEFVGRLFGVDTSLTYDLNVVADRPVLVQARKHKNNRINKKWLKKYGYKELFVSVELPMTNCTITPDEFDDDCYTISGDLKGQ